MRLRRLEIVFLVFLGLMTSACLVTFWVANGLSGALQEFAATPRAYPLFPFVTYLYAVSGLLLASVGFGLVMIYPKLRAKLNESGELQAIARTMTEQSQNFRQAALTDALTGLQNRRYFDDALEEYLDEFGRIGRPLGVMVIDLDHFKQVNDAYGHDVGDEVLRRLGSCLMDFTRYHDIVARLGGEEFAVVAPNLDAYALENLAERIREAVADMVVECGDVRLKVTASIGISSWDGIEGAPTLMKRADANLYLAKNNGRNRVAA